MEKYLPLNKILTKYCTIILLLVALFSSSLSYATGCSSRVEIENVCQTTYTTIPDVNFEQRLIDIGIDSEGGPTDGQILTADAEAQTSLLSLSSFSISDLTGIEAFINITHLDCSFNQLTSLDVSLNTALTGLNCYSNQLTSLDVSQNTALINLRCNSNQLISLDIRNGNNTNFYLFSATINSLTCISVDDPAYSTANWTEIDPGVVFSPGCDSYTAIPDANFEQKLIDLGIDTEGGPTNGFILTADAEAKTGSLDVSNSSISDLTGIEAFINIAHLNCHSNQLTSLDVSQNIALHTLYCQSNQLSSLDVSQNTALLYFICSSNQLSSLDVSLNTVLKDLRCNSNQLTTLDVSQNMALIQLYCQSNQLSSMDVSLNTVLTKLGCNSNQLTELDVRNGNNTNFTYFNATNNSLTCISVDDPAWSTTNWTNVDAGAVFSPDCDNYTAIPDANFEQKLIDLGFDTDGITGWILNSSAASVTYLYVNSSNISDLTGIEAFIGLTALNCHSNQLTSLDPVSYTHLTLPTNREV